GHREAPHGRGSRKAGIQIFDIGLEDCLACRRGVLLPKARGLLGKLRKRIGHPANEDEVGGAMRILPRVRESNLGMDRMPEHRHTVDPDLLPYGLDIVRTRIQCESLQYIWRWGIAWHDVACIGKNQLAMLTQSV